MTTTRSDNRGREIHNAEQKEAGRHPRLRDPKLEGKRNLRYSDNSLYEVARNGQLFKLEERVATAK